VRNISLPMAEWRPAEWFDVTPYEALTRFCCATGSAHAAARSRSLEGRRITATAIHDLDSPLGSAERGLPVSSPARPVVVTGWHPRFI
jgi:hypothetical protein